MKKEGIIFILIAASHINHKKHNKKNYVSEMLFKIISIKLLNRYIIIFHIVFDSISFLVKLENRTRAPRRVKLKCRFFYVKFAISRLIETLREKPVIFHLPVPYTNRLFSLTSTVSQTGTV